MAAARRIFVDDREFDPGVGEFFRKVVSYIAPSRDDRGVDAGAQSAEVGEEVLEFLRRGGNVDRIALAKNEIARRYGYVALTLNGADQHLGADGRRKARKGDPVEARALTYQVFEEFETALGERFEFDRGRESENASDLAGGRLFGIDRHRKTEIVSHNPELLLVLGIPHAGDGMRRSEFLGTHADKKIDLVSVRAGDHEIRRLRSGFFLDAVQRAVAADADDVAGVYDILDDRLVDIDNGDVVRLGRKTLGE